MSAIRSAVALRTLLVDTLAEMSSINSVILPNGATVYEAQGETLWRLDKDAGDTFDSLLGSGLVLRPDDQSDARWIAEEIQGSNPYYHSSYLQAPVAVTMTGNQWNQLGSTAGTFSYSAGSVSAFSLDLTTGLITYNGPPRRARVTMAVSLNNGIGATPIEVHACISRNGDVVDGSTTNYPEKGEQARSVTDVLAQIVVERIIQLNPSITLQLMLRNVTNADDLVATYYQATVEAL